MNRVRCCIGSVACALLAACSSSSDTPSVTVAFEPATVLASFSAGDEIDLAVTVRMTASDGSPVFAAWTPTSGALSATTPARQSDGSYTATLKTSAALAAGTVAGEVELRACRDAACTTQFSGSPARLPFRFTVAAVPEWDSYQGNVAHTGYVPITLNPAQFQTAWRWTSPNAATGAMPFINSVTASAGLIAVTDDDYFAPQSLHVLNESDGSLRWRHAFADDVPALNPPTIKQGRVYVATSGHEDTFMHGFDAAAGSLVSKTPFTAQWGHYVAPTVADATVYNAGGQFGGLYAFNSADGVLRWTVHSLPMVDMFTPALDASNAYFYAGGALHALNRSDGAVAFSITDPAPDRIGPGYHGAPIVGGRNNVIAFSGENFSGRASASTGPFDTRSLLSFDLPARRIAWRSAQQYITQPALARGVVYAGSRSPVRLAALDEATGEVLWWWTPQDNSSDFCRNVIATDSHVFVSTDRAVHAIDLRSRQSVWTFPSPGELALTSNRTLLINPGCRESTGELVAVRLNAR